MDIPSARAFGRSAGNLFVALGLVVLLSNGAYYAYGVYQLKQWGVDSPNVSLPVWAPVDPPPVFEAPEIVGDLPRPASPPANGIRISSIAVNANVVELGTVVNDQGELVWETAKHAVGHHQGTANPGDPGNIVMSGHISSPVKQEGNVFSRLPDLKTGAEVFVDTLQGSYEYRVVSRRVVEPAEVGVMGATDSQVLTRITCFPDWIYSHRLVVVAEPVRFIPHALSPHVPGMGEG